MSAVISGSEVLTEEQYIDLCVALAFLEESERKLAAVYLAMDCPHEFDGIYDEDEPGDIQDARKELEKAVHESERACYRWSKRLRYLLEKNHTDGYSLKHKSTIWEDMRGV